MNRTATVTVASNVFGIYQFGKDIKEEPQKAEEDEQLDASRRSLDLEEVSARPARWELAAPKMEKDM